ncbi:hypothetical protein [Oceanobacillus neutriphilus]|uniref:Phage capsid protein n=1 Tax=Oceanobacillus neutriphilus TaxID=531815 RepID=A0ABQ2NMS1_9BACI|nr:hypothetical protein [Oceanobacillus neutriphilus]GGP07289.1 hypothetical protein GCM10011346_02680 [Oceanobacillus neutriphilus]
MTKNKSLPLNLQFFAEEDLTTAGYLGEVRSIDFVTRFSSSIEELLQVLGVTRRLTLSQDGKIQTYKWERELNTDQVGEGEDIPLSRARKVKDKAYTVPFNKYRKVASAEAIHRHGYEYAVNQTDDEILGEIQGNIKDSFFTYLDTAPTTQDAAGFQKALALGWAKAKSLFPGNPSIVSFVSAMDVAKYLGDAPISSGASTAYGFTLLTGFLNQNVLVFDDIPEGKVYTTAVENIVFANQGVSGNDLARAFNLTTDQTGLIGVTHGPVLRNATIETVAFEGSTLFAEIPEGVVETAITDPSNDNGNDGSGGGDDNGGVEG